MEVMVRGKPVTLDYVADLDETGRAGSRGPIYRITLDGEEIVGSTHSALDACRALQKRGLSGRIGFRHNDGMIGLVTTIDAGAKLTVSERSGKPRFDKWQPRPQMGAETDAIEP